MALLYNDPLSVKLGPSTAKLLANTTETPVWSSSPSSPLTECEDLCVLQGRVAACRAGEILAG